MGQRHDALLAAVAAEGERLASRRGVVAGVAALFGLALTRATFAQEATPTTEQTTIPSPTAVVEATTTSPDLTIERDFADDLDVLNYALTLEHLENAFYRDGVGLFDFGVDPFGNAITDYLLTIGQHEAIHVATLTEVITGLGGTPVTEQPYDFTAAYADPQAFLQTAQALENVGVAAYDGAAAALTDPELLTAAGTIVAVEALHASYLNLLNNDLPAPQPFETPLSRDEVLAQAAPFLPPAATVGGAAPAAATPAAETTAPVATAAPAATTAPTETPQEAATVVAEPTVTVTVAVESTIAPPATPTP